jgi:hypothetical protein
MAGPSLREAKLPRDSEALYERYQLDRMSCRHVRNRSFRTGVLPRIFEVLQRKERVVSEWGLLPYRVCAAVRSELDRVAALEPPCIDTEDIDGCVLRLLLWMDQELASENFKRGVSEQ